MTEQKKILVKSYQRSKKNVKKSIPYRKNGFWGGWKQLLAHDLLNNTKEAERFKNFVCKKYSIAPATFDRWKCGYIFKNKSLQVAVENSITGDFATFGITENIWNNKD